MYTSHQALPQGLNDKLVGVTPAPTTFTDPVKKGQSNTPQRYLDARIRSNITDDNVNFANTSDPPTIQELSEEEKLSGRHPMPASITAKEGHFTGNCRSRPPT